VAVTSAVTLINSFIVLFFLSRPSRVVKYCDEYVSLSAHIGNSKIVWMNFTKFLCMLPVAMAQSFCDCIAIHYVLLVLRMT